MLQYYARFLPNLSTILNPLNELLQKNKQWKWTAQCETAFKFAKDHVLSGGEETPIAFAFIIFITYTNRT